MKPIFIVLWLSVVVALGLRSTIVFAEEEFETGMTYVAIISLIILATFGNSA